MYTVCASTLKELEQGVNALFTTVGYVNEEKEVLQNIVNLYKRGEYNRADVIDAILNYLEDLDFEN